MRNLLLAVCGSVAMAAATAAPAATYFIDDTGAANCATATHADCAHGCRTWAALVAQHAPAAGDHIKFCTGTYRERVTINQSGTAGNPIVLERASVNDTPEINGTDLCTSWTSQGSGVYSCPFTPTDSGCANGIQKLFVDRTPMIEAQATGCPSPVTNLPAGQWCWSSNTVYLHKTDGSSPSANAVEVGSRSQGIVAVDRSYITLDGLAVFGTEGYCGQREYAISLQKLWVTTAGLTVQHCTVRYPGTGILITGTTDATVASNTIEDMAIGWSYPPAGITQGLFALRFQNTDSVTITGNTFQRLATHTWAQGLTKNCAVNGSINTAACYAHAMSVQSVTGAVTVTDNVLTDVETGVSVKVDAGSVISAGSEISRNILRGWPHPATLDAYDPSYTSLGIYCEGAATGSPQDCTSGAQPSPKPIVHELKMERNQILGGFRAGILVSIANQQAADAYTVRVANNIVKSGDATFHNAFCAAVYLYPGTDGVQMYNNTIQCEQPSAGGGSGLYIGSGVQADFRNNILDFDGCKLKITDSSSAVSWGGSDNIGDVPNAGRCTAGANSISYVNENGSPPDLHLRMPSTTVVGKGVNLQGVTTDIDGQTRPAGAVDIGADQVVIGTGPPPPTLISVAPLP